MKQPALLAAVLIATGAIALPSSRSAAMPADAQRPDNLESVRLGRETARHYCSRCHAIGRRGSSPNPRAPRFPLIAERYPEGNPASALADGTVFRHPGMPEFRLRESETDGLIAYLRRISRLQPP